MSLDGLGKREASAALFEKVQWGKIMTSGVFLDHKKHQLLGRAKDNLGQVMSHPADAKELVDILMQLADNCTTDPTVLQYAFTRIEEILGLGGAEDGACGTQHASLFLKNDHVNEAPFLKALEGLETQDPYLEKSAALGLACLYTVCDGKESHLIRWINSKLTSPSQGVWEMALPSLGMLSRKQTARNLIITKGCLGHLVDILKRVGVNGNAQQLYELTFAVWTLSLGADVDMTAFLNTGSINVLVDLVAAAPSRKVTRVAVATLVNLASNEKPDVLMEMFTTPLQKLIDGMVQSNSYKLANDPEFETDVKSLHEVLMKNYRELSTFERWSSEVSSGNLRWGIVHTEKFWRENFKFVEKDEFAILKKLIENCLRSSDPTIVCIALYDLGEFSRFYPNGRIVVSTLGGKDVAMKLISDKNPEIQRTALQAVSKIMLVNLAFSNDLCVAPLLNDRHIKGKKRDWGVTVRYGNMQYSDDAPLSVGAMRAIMEPILARLHSIDERQARLELSFSQPGSPARGLLGSSGMSSFPNKLRSIVAEPIKYAVDQRIEVEYRVPTPKLGGLQPGEIPRKKGKWYSATILADRGDSTYDVVYDDGEREIRVSVDLMRPMITGGAVVSRTPTPTAPSGTKKGGGGRQSKSAGSSSDFAVVDALLAKHDEYDASNDHKEDLPSEESKSGPRGVEFAPEVAASSASEGKSQEPSQENKGSEHHGDDDEMVAGGGDESGCVKPWLGAVKPPKVPPAINPAEPSESLELTWVHGYTSASCGKYSVSNNLFYNKDGDAVFPAAALGVKLSSKGGGQTQTYFQGHDDDILCLAMSKCKRFAATGQIASHTSKGKGHVCIWDCNTMTLLTKLESCHQRGILVLSFSPDGTKLLSVGLDDDNTHIVFGSTNGWKKVDKLSSDKGDKAGFLFSCWVNSANPITAPAAADSFNMVSASDKNIHLWSVDGAKLGRKKGSLSKKVAAKDVKMCCASNFATKDGWKVAMGGADGSIYLFGGKEADASIPSAHGKDILSMAEGGAGCTFLVTGGADKMVRVWSSELQKIGEFDLSPFAKVDASVASLDLRPDFGALLCGTLGGEIVEITPTSAAADTAPALAGASASVMLYSHFRGELWGLAMHPTDNDIIATVGDDCTLRIWSISQNKLLSTTNIGWPGRALTWHPEGEIIAVGLYELVKGGQEKKAAKGDAKKGDADKKASVLLYSAARSGDSFTCEKVASGCPSVAWICDVRFSPSGNLLGVGSHDKKFYAYKVTPGAWADTFKKEKYVFNKHSSAVLHMDFTGDEKFLQTTCQAGELLFHDCETGKQETSAVKMAEYHGTDGVAEKRVFSSQTCTLGWTVVGIWPTSNTDQFINSCDRAPNGKLITTADDDGEVKIFRYPAAQELSKFKASRGHSSHVTTVRFNCTSDCIASVGGNDKCLFVWKVKK